MSTFNRLVRLVIHTPHQSPTRPWESALEALIHLPTSSGSTISSSPSACPSITSLLFQPPFPHFSFPVISLRCPARMLHPLIFALHEPTRASTARIAHNASTLRMMKQGWMSVYSVSTEDVPAIAITLSSITLPPTTLLSSTSSEHGDKSNGTNPR